MKKSYLSALTTALIIGAASTTFAAANPFSDVPAGHWAYDAVTKLASEGIIEGYGDGTFRGNRNITRYEMAQMVAKALSKIDYTLTNTEKAEIQRLLNTSSPNLSTAQRNAINKLNRGEDLNADEAAALRMLLYGTAAPPTSTSAPATHYSGPSRADLDKLASEFRDELDVLGVRVADLERNADFVKWGGKIEYAYDHVKDEDWSSGLTLELEPSAEVNDNWSANAKFTAEVDTRADVTTNAELERIWAEGDYGKFNVKLGRMELYTNESGLIWDDNFSGGQLEFGSNFKVNLLAGRLADDGIDIGDGADTTDLLGANMQYELENGIRIGGGYYYLKDKDFKTTDYSKKGNTDKANVWSANLGYNFAENFGVWGAYAQNTKADLEKSSWQAEVDYGTYDDAAEKGAWGVWAGYRRYGSNVSFIPTEDDTMRGTKGWFVGAGYAPFDNVGVTARYFDGKYLSEDKEKVKHFLGKIEFFF